MIVNFVETVQLCVPMRTAPFAKGVQVRFVMTADNVHFVPSIFSVKVVACAVNVVGNLFVKAATIATIVQQFVNAENTAIIVLHCVRGVISAKIV